MSQIVLTREQVRAVDQVAIKDFGMPGIVLMENAARGVAELFLRHCDSGKVVVACGVGNNGGDGFAIARHLSNRGMDVSIVIVGDRSKLTPDAATNESIARKMKLRIESLSDTMGLEELSAEFEKASWIVDALLGTGTKGRARSPYLEVIELINQSQASVLSVDLPSGMDCDAGPVEGATVRATITGTFVAHKTGFFRDGSADFTGPVEVIDIGQPSEIIEIVRAM
ncbi:Bifunctional NAD(P)H-hydrate repair enzyme Nnr [Thalassoglobus neptunius]|uniref:NAD(P)H-hydrate epimerase n=1 Tax=Thalassoglobus neptunius TaxID=1938619 RepID=A0A5C5VWX5_9PLAN|nr:NAD(P)H-hydrate epimerase [Thalassoglobus neptunius]TWT43034.1 Bifunctional NAD(P)H-hydrate repair enzyme Nnr [Thalassoglobus neptunius]